MTTIDLDTITLYRGAHDSPDDGMCMMEAVSLLAGEPFSDHPTCVSPVIAEFCRSWNDSLDKDARNRLLKPFARKVIGTATTEADEQVRAWMCTDWLVRTFTPAWFRKCGLGDDARALEQCDALTSADRARAAMSTIKEAQRKADAARIAAAAVARDAVWDIAWTAAAAAAWDAAGAAAGDVARAAVWDVAWAAVWDVARTAAWNVARTAAGGAVCAAVWDVAWAALADTITELQQSACDLLDRMCTVGRT